MGERDKWSILVTIITTQLNARIQNTEVIDFGSSTWATKAAKEINEWVDPTGITRMIAVKLY